MCMSKPNIPKVEAPPPVQDAKQPDSLEARRRQRQMTGQGPGTALTGPSGVATSGLNLGGTTVLGG